MPNKLKSGAGSMRENIKELTSGPIGAARKKAIATIAKKQGISLEEARAKQAFAIAKSQLYHKKKSKKADIKTYMAL